MIFFKFFLCLELAMSESKYRSITTYYNCLKEGTKYSNKFAIKALVTEYPFKTLFAIIFMSVLMVGMELRLSERPYYESIDIHDS
jgi:hypothetical protein